MNFEFFFTYMLQNKLEVIKQALSAALPRNIIKGLVLLSILSFSIFGFMIGSSHSVLQGIVSAVKLPFLFYVTGLICFPTLYIFMALLGVPTSLKGIAQFSVLAISIMSLILMAFAPVSLFFLVIGTHYQTFKLLNVGMMAIAGISGVYLFSKYILVDLAPDVSHSINRSRLHLFIRLWLIMYGVIGANLGFVLSPMFGDPTEGFIWFTTSDQNFFTHISSILF
ncbi:MAG: hypothetical protein JJ975_17395 [Bacteroidia bacterium]|nr:hypothetical protein [Bacteroidia bacterium]